MTDRMTVSYIADGIVIEGNLRIRRYEHGYGSLPMVEVGDKYKTLCLAEILEKEFDGDNFGKTRITIRKLGGDDG